MLIRILIVLSALGFSGMLLLFSLIFGFTFDIPTKKLSSIETYEAEFEEPPKKRKKKKKKRRRSWRKKRKKRW